MAFQVKNPLLYKLSSVLTPGPAIRLIKFFWPALLVLRDIRMAGQGLIRVWTAPRDWAPPQDLATILRYDYDVRIVPERAQHPRLFDRLVHQLLATMNIVFVVNMAPGMGHNTIELDYFLRLSLSERLPPKRYVLLRAPNMFHNDTMALYRRYFWFTSNSVLFANLLAPIIARYEDIRLNVGLSRLRWQLREDGSWMPPPYGQTFLHQISKTENRAEWMSYFKLRRETKGMTPLKDGLKISPALQEFLGGRGERLALVHIKYHAVNATARPTDPLTYLPAIRWLQEQGYRVVMIGREKMPKEFAALNVLDYANSTLACYRHDLELVAAASIVITAGSGIAMMPDCMDIPLLYLNSWHIGMPLTSEQCVMVPTLVIDRRSKRTLTISEQCELYFALEDKGDEIFPVQDYEPRDASEDEILAAVKEVLQKTGESISDIQLEYRRLTMKDQESLVGARISQYFIDKHANLLDDSPRVEQLRASIA